jgi:hypothetical protein
MDSGPARFFAPYAHVVFDFWEEYVEISLLDDLGGEVKRSGEMSVVITTHCAWLRLGGMAASAWQTYELCSNNKTKKKRRNLL